MSKRTRESKGKSRLRKINAKARIGNYYFMHNEKSQAGVKYTPYKPLTGFKIPKIRYSLGLWDKFIPLPKEAGSL